MTLLLPALDIYFLSFEDNKVKFTAYHSDSFWVSYRFSPVAYYDLNALPY